MTETIDAAHDVEVPAYPMRRAEGCPFDPPPQLRELQEQTPITKVRLWNGDTPWLVTGYAEQRQLLGDPRVSSDMGRPGFPRLVPTAPSAPANPGLSFISMDDPEHARLRRMVTSQFAIKRIETMRPAVQRIVDDLVD